MKITDIKKVFGRRAVQVRIAFLVAVAVIAFLVVKYDVRTETRMKCVLTGSDRVVTTRFGFSSDVVSRNEVSRWAERYGNPEITPGLCGWQTVGSSTKRWFVPTINGVHASPRNVVNVLHDRSLGSADGFEGRLLRDYYRQISTKLAEKDKSAYYILNNYLNHCPPMIVPNAQAMTITCFYQDQLSPPPPLTFEVANAQRRDAVVTGLRDLRWIPTSLNPSRTVSFVPPDFDILLTDNAGKLHTYHFYWHGDYFVGSFDGSVAENLQQLRDQITLITGLSSRPKVPPASE